MPSSSPNPPTPGASSLVERIAPLSPEREAEIREWVEAMGKQKDIRYYGSWQQHGELLGEIDRVRAELDRRTEDLAFLERATLPELRRDIQHHKDGKQRWRDRAEKAEAERDELRKRVAELERPAIEALRGEIQLSYRQLAAQAREDRDYEGEATVLQRLAEREQQWARQDQGAVS